MPTAVAAIGGRIMIAANAAQQALGFRAGRAKLRGVQTFILRLMLVVVALAWALCMTARASYADRFGDSRWCRVTNKGDITSWHCEYVNIDDCMSGWVKGRGFCAINPDWHPSSRPFATRALN